MRLGQAIKQIREKEGLTQNDLCSKIGFTQTFLSQVESGNKYPSLAFLNELSRVFEIPVPFIFWDAMETEDLYKKDKRQLFEAIKSNIDTLIKSVR